MLVAGLTGGILVLAVQAAVRGLGYLVGNPVGHNGGPPAGNPGGQAGGPVARGGVLRVSPKVVEDLGPVIYTIRGGVRGGK